MWVWVGVLLECSSFSGAKLTKIKFKGKKRPKNGLGKNGGNIKIIGFGVDFDDMLVIRECNGDMRPFWGGKFQTILIIPN
jgi:hypothetical protein